VDPLHRGGLQIRILVLVRIGDPAEIRAAAFRHDAAVQGDIRRDVRAGAVGENCDRNVERSMVAIRRS